MGRLSRLVRSRSGTVDLPGLMVGVFVSATVALSSVLSVQVLVPWQQDRSAVAEVSKIAPAQQSALNATGSFASTEALVESRWLESRPDGVEMIIAPDKSCWQAGVVSQSGTVFLADRHGVQAVGDATHFSTCLDATETRALVARAGGPEDWSKIDGVVPAPTEMSYTPQTRTIAWGAADGATGYKVVVTCGSSLGGSPVVDTTTAATVRTVKLPGSCKAGTPITVSVQGTSATPGAGTGRPAGLGAIA